MSEANTHERDVFENAPRRARLPRSRAREPRIVKEWLGLKELTHYADISERTIRSWIYSPVDPLPAAKVCGKVLVRKSDFDAYLERYRIKPFEELKVDDVLRDVL